MGKRKPRMSQFSTLAEALHESNDRVLSNEYHHIDNEYFVASNSIDDIQKFYHTLNQKQQEQPINVDEETETNADEDNDDMDMKSFAQQFLIDLPEQLTKEIESSNQSHGSTQELFSTNQPINWSPKVKASNNVNQASETKKRKSTTPVKRNTEPNAKRQRRAIEDLSEPCESRVVLTNASTNRSRRSLNTIFQRLQDESSSTLMVHENMNFLSTVNQERQSKNNETAVSPELTESSLIKNEPMETTELITETKQEPVELDTHSTSSMSFGTSRFSGDLDSYVQNIHLLHQSSNVEESNSIASSRPKRIRKKKQFYIEESESISKPKRTKIPIRKKRPVPSTPQISSTLQLTDAEIEQQFGERLPTIKAEHNDDNYDDLQRNVNNQFYSESENTVRSPQTPIEKARAKLLAALERGHGPDTYLLKIRSREHHLIEVQLAIFGTADWHPHRTKILSKIEEALRGLRVSWTKIDIHVDYFDIQISTSSQMNHIAPPTNTSNANSSWFLKTLSESGPIIVHIHDRRYPQQRFAIKCSCPECSPAITRYITDSSLPVIVSVSPAATPVRRLMTPSILNKSPSANMSSLHNIDTGFFNDLIHQWGRTTVITVTQCVLDLALIVSVHASIQNLCVPANCSKEEYRKRFQQVIDPLKCTLTDNDKQSLSKPTTVSNVVSINSTNTNAQSLTQSKTLDILAFHNAIMQNKTNIRNAHAMRELITKSFSTSVTSPVSTQSNIIKARALILPKSPSTLPIATSSSAAMTLLELKKLNEQNRRLRRRSMQTNRYDKYTRNYLDNAEAKQQPQCTSFIELKPIMSGPVITKQNINSFTRDTNDTITVRDGQTNELKKITTIISASNSETNTHRDAVNSSLNNNPRVIRLSIAKSTSSHVEQQPSSTSSATIRLVTSTNTSTDRHSVVSDNKGETVPLVPKQINIIKPLSSSSSTIAPPVKLSNPILIANRTQPSSTK